jgi:uncharacterized membrane protein YfcA
MNSDKQQPYYNARAATTLALGAGSAVGIVVYLLNGQDYVRAAIAAVLCGLIGWYSGKAFFPRVAAPTTESVN